MIHVAPQPEPADFDAKVRRPGLSYLASCNGSKIEWKNPKAQLWRRCAKELYDAYQGICCYTAMRIMPSSAAGSDRSSSVEHFVPKSESPELAYEWSNYRLASRKANADRGTQKVLDPFEVEDGWFALDLFTGELAPGEGLNDAVQKAVESTIGAVRLNDPEWTRLRHIYYARFLQQGAVDPQGAMEDLKENAPIVWTAVNGKPKN